tara:strand:+ start:322 stop:693 length:372 start_codon:yes stop_codon:yes gene_type:complete
MVDLTKVNRRSSRINEETLIEKGTLKQEPVLASKGQATEAVQSLADNQNVDSNLPDYDIPTLKREKRGRKAQDYSHEPTRKLSVDLPITVFKAFSRLCIDEDLTKTDFVPELIIKELKKKKYL